MPRGSGRKNPDLSSREMRVISNVYHHFKSEAETQGRSGIPAHQRTPFVSKTAELCCVHPSTVARIVKLGANDPTFASAGSKRSKTALNALSWKRNMSFLRHDIRIRMAAMYEDKKFPSLDSLMKFLFELYPDIPRISKKTFRLWMKRWGFRYKRSNNFDFYMERADVMQDCADFLAEYEKYVNMGFTPVHGDETWVPANHTVPKTWQWKDYDTSGKFCGFRGTMKIKSGAGERLIINHFISKDGFIPNALDLFVGKTGCGDYHKEMNGDHYENYVKTQLAPNLPDKTLLVMDRASYHSVLTEDSRCPASNWLKEDIENWCLQKGLIKPCEQLTKDKLLDLVKANRPPKKYVVDEILKDIPGTSGVTKQIKVLRLPTKHCFFNPIELVWAYIKGYVARRNHTCKLKESERLTKEAITMIPSDYISRCYEHVNKIMDSFRKSGRYLRCEVDPLVIANAFESDESDTPSWDDDSETEGDRHDLGDEELDLDTDEELALEEEVDDQIDEEVNTINAVIEETARDQKTSWTSESRCSCKTGCSRNTCSCNKAGERCNPRCSCSDDCVNRRQLLPGFSMKRTRIGPVDRPASPIQAGPAHPPQRKKKARNYQGHCRCTSRGSCAGGYCVCYNHRKVCNASCKCFDYFCQNKDAKRLAHLPPKNLFNLDSATSSDTNPDPTSGSSDTNNINVNPPNSSIFDFTD